MREHIIKLALIVFAYTSCAPATTGNPATGPAPAREAVGTAVKAFPASSSCNAFDPTGVWTLRSDAHEPRDFQLAADNTVALNDGVLRWFWESEPRYSLKGCVVRFEHVSDSETCEYALVELNAAASGFVSCCENDSDERAICNEFEVTGVVRLAKPLQPRP